MKINGNLELKKIGNNYMIVESSNNNINMTNIYSMNESAAMLWQKIGFKDFTFNQLVNWIREEYIVEESTAKEDIIKLLKDWKEFGLII